jgi:hypothetical protein
MSSLTPQSISSNTQKFGYDGTWSSLYSIMLTPQKWGEIIQKYGPLMGMFEALQFTGSTVNVKSHEEDVFIEGSLERSITLGVEATAATTGATFTFRLSSSDYDTTTGRPYLLVDDKILIPKEYMTIDGVAATYDCYYQVQTVGANSSANCTAFPENLLYAMSANIPIGTELMVTGGNYAPGSDGPGSRNSGWYEDTFYTNIKKRAFSIEGGQQSTERYFEKLQGGGTGIFNKASIETDFLLNSDVNDDILTGTVPDNTNLVMANRDSVNSIVYGTKGIIPHLADDGMELLYTDTFLTTDLDHIKTALLSQGVTDTNVNFFVGPTLYKYVENSALEFIKEYSGGTNLYSSFNQLGITLQSFKKNGIVTTLHELKSFANPVKFGISSYEYGKEGFIIPETMVTTSANRDGSGAKKIKNLVLGYKNYNGENRTRIVMPIPGVNGHASSPNVAVDSYDDYRVQMLTEYMLMFFKINQCIRVRPA